MSDKLKNFVVFLKVLTIIEVIKKVDFIYIEWTLLNLVNAAKDNFHVARFIWTKNSNVT